MATVATSCSSIMTYPTSSVISSVESRGSRHRNLQPGRSARSALDDGSVSRGGDSSSEPGSAHDGLEQRQRCHVQAIGLSIRPSIDQDNRAGVFTTQGDSAPYESLSPAKPASIATPGRSQPPPGGRLAHRRGAEVGDVLIVRFDLAAEHVTLTLGEEVAPDESD